MATPALTRITAQDAESEPADERTFPTAIAAAHFPKRSYAISVMSPAGYPITITLNDMKLDQVDDALATLLERGYMPAEVPSVLPPPNVSMPAAQPATGAAPFCPIHTQRQMKVSNYGGWFCTFSDPATGEKCKQKIK